MKIPLSLIIQSTRCRTVDSGKVSELAASIGRIGLLHPVTLSPENRLIAGAHRLAAARTLGWSEIESIVLTADELSAELAEIDENLIRNELDIVTVGELAIRRDEILSDLGERARSHGNGSNQHKSKGADSAPLLKTTESIAREIGVSERVLQENKQLAKNLVPVAKEVVRSGEVSKQDALKISRMPAERQVALAERIQSGEAKTIKEAELIDAKKKVAEQSRSAVATATPTIHVGDGIRWLLDQEPCDLLLTDPPYSTEVPNIDQFARSWLPAALAKLKPTGSAYVFIGAYPHELRAYLNIEPPNNVRLEQILVWTYKNTLGNNPKARYKQNWQAILFYCGVDSPPLDCPLTAEQWAVMELNAPDGRLGNRFHAWQKPDELAERLIRHRTRPGDTVLDPFCCTGTFLLAAGKLGRIGKGAELDREHAKIALERGCVYA